MEMALIKVRGPPKLVAENNRLLDRVLFEISGYGREGKMFLSHTRLPITIEVVSQRQD